MNNRPAARALNIPSSTSSGRIGCPEKLSDRIVARNHDDGGAIFSFALSIPTLLGDWEDQLLPG